VNTIFERDKYEKTSAGKADVEVTGGVAEVLRRRLRLIKKKG
jgi:hypothetical protein